MTLVYFFICHFWLNLLTKNWLNNLIFIHFIINSHFQFKPGFNLSALWCNWLIQVHGKRRTSNIVPRWLLRNRHGLHCNSPIAKFGGNGREPIFQKRLKVPGKLFLKIWEHRVQSDQERAGTGSRTLVPAEPCPRGRPSSTKPWQKTWMACRNSRNMAKMW